MSAFQICLARLKAFLSGNRTDRLEEELALHSEMLAEDYRKRGINEVEARYAAARELGNRTALKEEYREHSGLPVLEIFCQDVRYALRGLRRNPAFAASSLATLTVGLSGMIAVLCIVSTLLWTPLPYPGSARLSALRETDPKGGSWPFSEPALLDLEQRVKSLEVVSGYVRGNSTLTGAGEPEAIQSAAVTPSFLRMFGVEALAGRLQLEHGTAVISRRLWRRKWQMRPAVVGQAIRVDGANYIVSAVAEVPGDLLPGVQLLLPLEPKAEGSRSAHEIEVVGRAQKGCEGRVSAELSALALGIARDHPGTQTGWGIRAVPLAGYLTGARTTRTLWMILAGVGLVWLLACSNVAGLQLARRIARQHEIETRIALGASRGRMLAQSLTESLVLALAGTVLGLGIADWAVHLLAKAAADFLPRLAGVHLDARSLAATCGCMLLSTLIFGVSPMRGSLAAARRGTSMQDKGRDGLMVAQVAFASVLILCASLLFHSFLRLQAVNPGFDPDRLWTVRIDASAHGTADWQRAALLKELSTEVKRVPGVAAVGATNVAPFSGFGTANRFRLEGESGGTNFRAAAWRAVTPGFFSAVNLPLRRGRLFTDADRSGSLEVVIVSASMARELWPNQDPLGKRLLWGSSGSPKTVVGVVGDMRDLTVEAAPAPTMFRPFAQLSDAPMTLLIRVQSTPAAAMAVAIRKAIWKVDANIPVQFVTVRRTMSDSLLGERGAMQVMAVFALVAMAIAGLGLYGLVSYRVTQRRMEIGIRLALGASPEVVRWAVQKRSVLLVSWGLLIGLPAAYACSTLIRSLLYQTSPTEWPVYAGVCVLFAVVAVTASHGPASRASRVEPASILRCE